MSDEILNFAIQYSLWSGYIIVPLGVIGNALNILVFTELKLFRNNRSAFYLIVESCFNFLYQFLLLSVTILTSIYGDDGAERSPIWCTLRYALGQISVLTTYSVICFAAIDQFLSNNYRLNLRQFCTFRLSRCLIAAFVCLWNVHSTAFGFSFNIQPSVGCILSDQVGVRYSTFFYYPVLIGLLPIAVASSFSLLAFRNVRQIVRRQLPIARRRLDRQMTAMVLFFVCLISPYTIYRIYTISFPIPKASSMTYAIGRLAQVIVLSIISLDHTISFYVFVLSSSRFRRQVKLALVKASRQCWRYSYWLKNNRISPENAQVHDPNMELEEIK